MPDSPEDKKEKPGNAGLAFDRMRIAGTAHCGRVAAAGRAALATQSLKP